MSFKLHFRAEPIPGASRVPQIIVGNVIPEVLASIAVFGRLYTRSVLTRSWGVDDIFVAISWLGSLALCIVSTMTTQYGAGHHMADVPLNDIEPSFKLTFSTAIVYLPTLAFLKISICLFYLRLFVDRKSRYLIIGTIIWILLFTIPCLFVWIFQCDPVRGAYDFSVHPKCISTGPIFYLSSVSEIVTDVWLISFITSKIWNINLQTKEKVVLLFILTLGWLSTVAAIVRLVRVTIVMNQDGADATWIAYDVSIWSGVEVAGGLFCVSAPPTRPLIKRYTSGFSSPMTSTFTRNDDLYIASNSARTGRMSNIRKGSQITGEALELHSTSNSDRRFPIPESSERHRSFSIHSDSGTVFGEERGQPGSESTENVLPIMKPEENSKRQST